MPLVVVASYDLPREARSRELSAIAWDAPTRRLFAISDDEPIIVSLVPNDDYRVWTIGEAIPVSVPGPWDGEGLVATETGFLIANEAGPHVYEVDRAGRFRGEIPIPAHYTKATTNASLESLTRSPDGRFLFVANEVAIVGDGAEGTTARGTLVRILRIDLASKARAEFAYRTDAIFAAGANGMIGVAEMAAISADELLVLERAYVPSVGNELRVYRTSLVGAKDVVDVASLDATTLALTKTLVFDVAAIEGQNSRSEDPSAHGLYPNYEGLALGPKTADGRRLLFLVSDDNGRDAQMSRVLVLSLDGM